MARVKLGKYEFVIDPIFLICAICNQDRVLEITVATAGNMQILRFNLETDEEVDQCLGSINKLLEATDKTGTIG